MSGRMRIVGGDFEAGDWSVQARGGLVAMARAGVSVRPAAAALPLAAVELLSVEKAKSLAAASGCAAAGAVAFGAVGALGGVLLGGNRTDVCFRVQLRDGRGFVATSGPQVFQQLTAAVA